MLEAHEVQKKICPTSTPLRTGPSSSAVLYPPMMTAAMVVKGVGSVTMVVQASVVGSVSMSVVAEGSGVSVVTCVDYNFITLRLAICFENMWSPGSFKNRNRTLHSYHKLKIEWDEKGLW